MGRRIPTPNGKIGWSAYTVRHMLKNRTYAVVIEALKTEEVEPKIRKGSTYGKYGRRLRPENERIRLEGLVERPVITEEEFEWMQRRLRENQQLAQKSTKVMVQGDGPWELELQVPREALTPAGDLQIVNSRPESNYI